MDFRLTAEQAQFRDSVRRFADADTGFPSADETAIAKALRCCRGWMIAGGSIEILKNRSASCRHQVRWVWRNSAR